MCPVQRADLSTEFESVVARLLNSSHDEARGNIKRLLALIADNRDLASIVAAAPIPQPRQDNLELINAAYRGGLSLPTDRAAELGAVMDMLSIIADAEDTPFFNYTLGIRSRLGADFEAAEFMRRFVGPSMEYLGQLLALKLQEREEREEVVAGIILQNEQEVLFTTIVEASRNVPRERRQRFYLIRTMGKTALDHKGLPNGEMLVYEGDIDALAGEGLISPTYGPDGTPQFDVSPRGYLYYESLARRSAEPLDLIEKTVNTYVGGPEFRQRHPSAYSRWLAAADKLSAADSIAQLTEIGHVCREAMQEFTEGLAIRRRVAVNPDRTKTVTRLREILAASNHLGSTEKPFLDALIKYWWTVADLSQRQEHGAGKEGDELLLEDARRLLFHTALVMYEIDRAIERRARS